MTFQVYTGLTKEVDSCMVSGKDNLFYGLNKWIKKNISMNMHMIRNPRGHYKFLHKLNPVRLEYIKSKVDLNNKKVLDIGCGGGILSEEIHKSGADVTNRHIRKINKNCTITCR